MEDIIQSIRLERKRQDEKWGIMNHHPDYWIKILGEEFGEACTALLDAFPHTCKITSYSRAKFLQNYQKELIQLAASAVAAIESLDRNYDQLFDDIK